MADTTTTVTIPTKVYEALCRVARIIPYPLGGPEYSIATDVRRLAAEHGSDEDVESFGYVAALLDRCQEWADSGAEIPDPDRVGGQWTSS